LTKTKEFYSFRQHDKNHFIFIDEVLVLVLVNKKTLFSRYGLGQC